MAELYVGLMSGTSVDAVDAVVADFTSTTPIIRGFVQTPIPGPLRSAILTLCNPGRGDIDGLGEIDNRVARLFAEASERLLASAGIARDRIAAIGSHGQTIRHRPEAEEPFTLQIGNPSLIAELVGIAVVADFRRRDMAAGGQGAPLAPAFHAAFLNAGQGDTAVANIGGMANLTVLPARGEILGFDTGPGNVLLDHWCTENYGRAMDAGGTLANGGVVDEKLLSLLLTNPFFLAPPPKSTGRERFNSTWLDAALRKVERPPTGTDMLATLAALTAESIALAVKYHAPSTGSLMVCGGGVHNARLMAELAARLHPIPVASTAAHGIDPDLLEALGFAWLARQTLKGSPGNVPTVTGAKGPRILGAIHPA